MYKTIINSSSILRVADNAFIPASASNSDYMQYIAWLEEGNIPEMSTGIACDEIPVDAILDPPEHIMIYIPQPNNEPVDLSNITSLNLSN